MGRKGTVKYVQLYPKEIEAINGYAEPRGLSFSDGLRLIVREWADMKAGKIVALPHPSDGQPIEVIYTKAQS